MKSFELGGVTFRPIETDRTNARSAGNEFLIVKDEATLQFYETLRPHLPKSILEIGMFEGGSLVYFDKLFKPTKLVGLDRRRRPIEALDEYRRIRPHIEVYYGRFQDQPGALQAARRSFPKGVDLIVDDASHLYRETKSTFEMLFPLVNPGGHYVVEKWRGPLWTPRSASEEGLELSPPTSQFLHELIAQIEPGSALDSITIQGDCVCIRKGRGGYRPHRLAPHLPALEDALVASPEPGQDSIADRP